jgi:hypothetical protein
MRKMGGEKKETKHIKIRQLG